MHDSETPVEQHLPRSLWMEADLLLDVDQDTSYVGACSKVNGDCSKAE